MMTTTLKIIYGFIAGIITVIITFLIINNKKKKTSTDKSDKQISDNKQVIDNAQGHIEEIEDQKQDVKHDIETRENVIEDLKDKADNVQPVVIDNVAEAKENIIKKTNRRGRKPKAKKS